MENLNSRRNFLKLSATTALGALVLSDFSLSAANAAPKNTGIGVQLYTIRDAMAKDVVGSLKKVADLGFKYLELANYSNGKFYGYEPAEFKKIVNDLGMQIISSHTQVEALGITIDNATKMAEDHAKLGVKYCIQPWVVEEARKTLTSYKKMAADWNKVGKIMKEHKIQFGYHNHNFEFDTVEGKIPYYDVLLPELDKDLVTMELDLFWATKAGQNPVEMFKKYPGRFQLFHMKDAQTKEAPFYQPATKDFAPVGTGIVNFKEILANREKAGLKYMFVEQDYTQDGKPFDSIKTSITNLRTKLLL